MKLTQVSDIEVGDWIVFYDNTQGDYRGIAFSDFPRRDAGRAHARPRRGRHAVRGALGHGVLGPDSGRRQRRPSHPDADRRLR